MVRAGGAGRITRVPVPRAVAVVMDGHRVLVIKRLLLWTGQRNGRPASYYLVADVRGTPVLSGPEALDHGPRNSFDRT